MLRDDTTKSQPGLATNMKIYLTRYGQGQARIVSMDANDKGHHWECEPHSSKLEFGVDMFFIPGLVAKGSKDVFLSMEATVASLKRRIERDITGAQEVIKGLYGQLAGLKGLLPTAPSVTIEQ